MPGLTYRDAGVDIEAGDRLVDRIKPLAARTRIPEVLGSVGGFAGLCALPADIQEPVLVSGTDGVGTKLKLAFQMDVHHTVGIDLVAMCVNDVLTVGARPLFFLDYFATGRLDVERAEQVVRGIAAGCEQAGCALLGGETAELPGLYADGEYDLAGFAVGVVGKGDILDGSRVRTGDALIGVASTGLHSNGYSLARRALLDEGGLRLDQHIDALGETLGEALLRPTRVYAAVIREALATGAIRAVCHVTGGGLPGNLPRVLPEGMGGLVRPNRWTVPPLFDLIARSGRVDPEEMRRTFNLGIGLVLVADAAEADRVLQTVGASSEGAWLIGEVQTVDGEPRIRYAS